MDFTTFVLVNGPCSIITTLTNVFLGFCVLFPQQEDESLKQPLNVLLGTLVLCNFTLQVCVLFFTLLFSDISEDSFTFTVVLETILFTMRTNVSSSLWLSVFYYCQIVPAQWCLFVFLKKHIKVFIYSALMAEKVFYLFGFIVGIFSRKAKFRIRTYDGTNYYLFIVDFLLRCAFSFLCLCLMFASNCATIVYLRKHMMGSSETARIQRQMRLTITGIVQTLLNIVCFSYIITMDILEIIFDISIEWDDHIILTVACLYSLGTTVNLCVGQSIFRQRILEAWQKFFRMFLNTRCKC